MKSLVLDLRGNPGGLLDQGVAVSELFLDPGQEVVATRGRAPATSKTYRDAKPQPWPNLPVVILTNGGTASAAEIITGALQDHDRAVVVGTPTFGKGLVQSLWQLTPETALKLTTARWFTPSGRTIQRKSKNEEDQLAQAEAAELGHDSTKVDSSLVFHTDHGRVVMGGGGIRPDLFVAPDTFTTAERGFVKGLGNKIPTYWDVRTAYALEIKTSGRVKTPDFTVTPDMADEVIRRLRARGVALPDSVVAGARNVISQDLGYEIARYVFGRAAEVRRQREEDRQVRAALGLARRAKSPQDLLALAAAQTPAPLRN
jgi:carboxyl-terminal processing protease